MLSNEYLLQKGRELRRDIEHATLVHVNWRTRPPRRRKRIVLTAQREGACYEAPRLQALARLQPIRVLDTGRVEDDVLLHAKPTPKWQPPLQRQRRNNLWERRWQRRHFGSHAKDILRREDARRMGY